VNSLLAIVYPVDIDSFSINSCSANELAVSEFSVIFPRTKGFSSLPSGLAKGVKVGDKVTVGVVKVVGWGVTFCRRSWQFASIRIKVSNKMVKLKWRFKDAVFKFGSTPLVYLCYYEL